MAKRGKGAGRAQAGSKSKAAKSAAGKRPAAAAARIGKSGAGRRLSWLDAKRNTPLIDQYARQLTTFIGAMADGVIDDAEVKAQEQRVAKVMRTVEPTLDDRQHAGVTQLLCELTAYDIMQMLNTMHQQRPQTKFRG